jgi:uncharacterized membrane protein
MGGGKEPEPILGVVERNIEALVAKRQSEEQELTWQERVAIRIAEFTGSMAFVVLHLLLYGGWVAISMGCIPGVPRLDPSLVKLAMAASVEAIFLSTFILMTQNRMMKLADRRADLTLQISLLAEHEITRLITITREMAKRMGVQEAQEPELDQLEQDVKPEIVLEKLDEQERRLARQK